MGLLFFLQVWTAYIMNQQKLFVFVHTHFKYYGYIFKLLKISFHIWIVARNLQILKNLNG